MSDTTRTGLKSGWIQDAELNTERRYQKEDGTPCTINWLVKNEPEWAVNQIKNRDKLERELNDVNEERNGLIVDLHAAGRKIKRLEEAGDAMAWFCADEVSLEQWNDAKKNQSQKENNQ